MPLFKRYYLVSTSILSVVAILSSISGINGPPGMIAYTIGGLTVGCLPLVPLLLKGGIPGNPRTAIGISVVLAALLGTILGGSFFDFVRTGGGEGPNGEGAPGAIIIAMTLFAALFFCPWLLTAIRGIRLWKSDVPTPDGGLK